MKVLIPLTPKWFEFKKLFRSQQFLEEKLRELLLANSQENSKNHIFFDFSKKSLFGLSTIHIQGEVNSEAEKTHIEKMIKNLIHDFFFLKNDLVIVK